MVAVSSEFKLPDADATETLGRCLAVSLPSTHGGGAVVYLQGELGTGKTTIARSLLHALGVTGKVRSPTYTLIDNYVLPSLTCVHIDLYRVQSLSEVEELGIRDLVGPGSLMLIEWPEKGEGAIPKADLRLVLAYDDAARQVSILPQTPLGLAWSSKLLQDDSLSPYVSNLT
jgi:tRNA threonylcarbamoyladenosine biosynthesis protein TsaE